MFPSLIFFSFPFLISGGKYRCIGKKKNATFYRWMSLYENEAQEKADVGKFDQGNEVRCVSHYNSKLLPVASTCCPKLHQTKEQCDSLVGCENAFG